MKRIFSHNFPLALTFLLLTTTAFAEQPDSFTGRIGIGFMMINSGNNLNPNGSKSYIESLESAADMEFTFLPLVLPSATWDIGEQNGVKLFFDSEPPIDEVGGFAFNIGSSYSLQDVAIIQLSAFFTPFEEVYKNPYLTGTYREASDTSKYGVKIAFNQIMGTGLRINFVYMNDDVDDDEIGALIPDMARDGAIYSFNVNYSFKISDSTSLRPQISFRKGEYDGESSSFNKIKASLKSSYRSGKVMVNPEIFYSYSEYDEQDRIFKQDRDNNSYGINVMINYMAPFGLQNWSAMSLLGYSRGDSNIEFYDTEAANFGLFLSYHF